MTQLTKEKPDLQKKVQEVPHKPGVYLMRDRLNRVIYVTVSFHSFINFKYLRENHYLLPIQDIQPKD